LILVSSSAWNMFQAVLKFDRVGFLPFMIIVALTVSTIVEWSQLRSNSSVTSRKPVDKFLW
jgi:hypothetical protein